MAKSPAYTNKGSGIVRCPNCGAWRVHRRHKACPKCKVGIKFRGEFIFPGDYFMDEAGKSYTYEELLSWPRKGT